MHAVLPVLCRRCEHCKRLVPQYEQAAATLAAEHLALAKVDATEDAELVSRFDVEGYPTLKVFRSGTPYEYEGPHTAAGALDTLCPPIHPQPCFTLSVLVVSVMR